MGKRKYYTSADYEEKANKIHNGKYSYPFCEVNSVFDKVPIVCPIHGEFKQSLNHHLYGKGCRECGKEAIGKHRRKYEDTSDYEAKAKKIHGGKYSYPHVSVQSSRDSIPIICPVHGEFIQTISNHLYGQGCADCGVETATQKLKKFYASKEAKKKVGDSRRRYNNTSDYEDQANRVHEGRYEYVFCTVQGVKNKISIVCPEHGKFEQILDGHLRGQGCPKCIKHVSAGEIEIGEFIKSTLSQTIISSDRKIIGPLELDIVVPEKKIAIEYCGNYWHSELFRDKNYHQSKHELCRDAGCQLITIFEDEWIGKQDIVKSMLRSKLGMNTDAGVHARKTVTKRLSAAERGNFLNEYHIQGDTRLSISIGLQFNGDIVAVMGLKRRHEEGIYELSRFATSTKVKGGFTKLLSYFKKNYEWKQIITFADLRYSSGDLYYKSGFQLDAELRPDYSYVYRSNRHHKFNFRKKRLREMFPGDSTSKTEHELAFNNGIYRIYDCGKLRFVMNNIVD